MSVQDFLDYLNSQTLFGVPLITILSMAIIAIIALILERVMTRYLRKFTKRTHLEPNVSNRLILTFRILVLIGAAAAMLRLGVLDTGWFVAFSALGGAAVGFASSQSIGNFIAGLYLLAARPFKVGDYVRVGTVEGVVHEITINFTKILTIGNNVISIMNLQVLQRDITNCLYEHKDGTNLYCCTFEIGFDHSVSTDKIAGIFSRVLERYRPNLPKEPSYTLTRSSAFDRVYTAYVYVKKPEQIFVLRPKIAEEIFDEWDKERARGNL